MFFRSCYSSNEPSYIIRTSVYSRFFNFAYLFISILQKIRSFSPGEKGISLIFKTVGIQQRKKRQKNSSTVSGIKYFCFWNMEEIWLFSRHHATLLYLKFKCSSVLAIVSPLVSWLVSLSFPFQSVQARSPFLSCSWDRLLASFINLGMDEGIQILALPFLTINSK